MNKTSHHIIFIVLTVIAFWGCKKDPPVDIFKKYAGSWTCTHFNSNSNARGNPSIESSYDLNNDGKLYYAASFRDTGGSINLKQTKDTFYFKYNITTSIVNGSQLLIKESYTGVKNNITIISFNYSRIIQLVEGQTNYGTYDDSYSITPGTITIYGFNHDSFYRYGWKRTLTRVQ